MSDCPECYQGAGLKNMPYWRRSHAEKDVPSQAGILLCTKAHRGVRRRLKWDSGVRLATIQSDLRLTRLSSLVRRLLPQWLGSLVSARAICGGTRQTVL